MIVENLATAHFSRFDISSKSVAVKVTVTVVLIVLANILKFSLQDYIGEGTPFLLYFGFTMLCGRFIGFWYAIACLLVCGIVAFIFFMLPHEGYTIKVLVKLIIYLLEGLFIASFTNGFRKTLNAVKQSSSNFKLLISKSHDGLARISKEGKLLYISPAIEIITGFNGEDLKNDGFDIFPAEDDRLEVAGNFLKIINEPGQSLTFVHRYKNKNSEIKWMETIFTNHLQVKGLNAIIANFRDVTERVESDIRKNDFMGIAAHEIKNPLTVVKLNTELQEIALENNNYQMVKKFNIVIKDNTKKIIHLLEEFMNFSGFEAALLHLDLTEFKLSTIIESALFTFSAAYNNEIQIHGETATIIYADRSRIEQVLINLLSNAAKYAPANSVITIGCNTKNDSVTISVTDRGMGIPEKELGLLFNKFHRVRSTQNKTKGYGLGLYICAEIIKAHNGRIGVESKEGEGSVFWFSLPLRRSN